MSKTNIRTVFKNRKAILEGIKNSIFKSDAVEEIAAMRNEICLSCEEIDLDGKECYVPGTQPCCGYCGCSLKLKHRSLSSACDLNKWEAVLSEEEEIEHDLLNPESND